MKKSDKSESALLFDWGRRESRGTWLLAWFMVTLLAISSLFIIFRIVTPEAPKLTTRPQQMIVLNPDVPAERALIHRAQDRSFTLIPTDSPGAQAVPSMAIRPQFQASVGTFEMKLKSSGSQITANERPSLMEQDYLDSLPALPRTAQQAGVKAPLNSVLRLQIRGDGARELVSGRDLKDISLVDPARPLFHVAVGSLGQILMAVPVAASEDPAVMVKLHAAMTQLRFQPRPKQEDTDWIEVGFAWEREEAP